MQRQVEVREEARQLAATVFGVGSSYHQEQCITRYANIHFEVSIIWDKGY
jgi:hypothetical protein